MKEWRSLEGAYSKDIGAEIICRARRRRVSENKAGQNKPCENKPCKDTVKTLVKLEDTAVKDTREISGDE